ncbi:MAG TPA: hypothetical protein VNN17_09630 [Terriglobia bacterium]|nr:hypothetical protein [Terriglobia bacterium]
MSGSALGENLRWQAPAGKRFTHRRIPAAALALALALAAVPGPARAQSHSHGYFFLAPAVVSGGGRSDAALQGGVGGEGVFPGGIGLGAELGVLGIRGDSDSLSGTASVNGYFHIPRALSSVDPFLTMGYSAVFDFFAGASLLNVGGGVNWWFAPRLGLKLEFRDHVRGGSDNANIATFRFGLAFH